MAFTLVGCKNNFLEIPSKTTLSTSIYFKSQSDFQLAVNGTYARLRTLSNMAYLMGEMRSDNTCYVYNPDMRAVGVVQAEYVKDFLDDANNTNTLARYSVDYSIIARANQVFDQIDNVDFDITEKNKMKGEAYFLRAFAYFDLVQYFGKVPLHLKPATNEKETVLSLSTVDDIYKQIISDATQAATLLPNKAIQVAGRATSGAANTLLGNVYIVLKRWGEAETTLKKVTGYSLIPSYVNIFDPNNKNNSESVFEVQYKEGNEGLNSGFFYSFLPMPITANEVKAITGIAEVSISTGEGFNIPTPDIIAAYEPNDSRKNASIRNIIVHEVSYPIINKYVHPHALSGNTNDNWPVYRYAEVLLFIAEALNEQGGKTTEALTYLNQVRTRAGLPNSNATDQLSLRIAIMNERRVELAFENKRWLDLVRTGTAPAVMTAYGTRVKANPKDYYYPAGITFVPAAFTDIRILFPIPANEVILNPYF
jgi:tetratricopeptide (TPR) repeat protein